MRRHVKEESLVGLRDELDRAPTKKEWVSYRCELVTPMYGGGVKAGEVDQTMPIRASAIRGHLRFWWRIASGLQGSEQLFEKETAIWGGIGSDGAKASQVHIRVICKPINTNQLENSKSIKGYGTKYILGAAEATDCLPSRYPFDLEICYSNKMHENAKKQVEEALCWWATFGGIGGRTRRGFGAIAIKSLEPILLSAVEDRGGKLAFGSALFNTAEEAWKHASQCLYSFRQGKELGRNKGEDVRPGRSRWPEPDQLRRMDKNHKKDHEPEHLAGNVFPRAAFGLPIIFDFNDRSRQEPQTMTLLPEGSLRMASPLIIRPYLAENGKWQAAALLLPNWEDALVEPLELSPSPSNGKPQSWPRVDQPSERKRLSNLIQPMQGRGDDPLSAFLDYFEKGIE